MQFTLQLYSVTLFCFIKVHFLYVYPAPLIVIPKKVYFKMLVRYCILFNQGTLSVDNYCPDN